MLLCYAVSVHQSVVLLAGAAAAALLSLSACAPLSPIRASATRELRMCSTFPTSTVLDQSAHVLPPSPILPPALPKKAVTPPPSSPSLSPPRLRNASGGELSAGFAAASPPARAPAPSRTARSSAIVEPLAPIIQKRARRTDKGSIAALAQSIALQAPERRCACST